MPADLAAVPEDAYPADKARLSCPPTHMQILTHAQHLIQWLNAQLCSQVEIFLPLPPDAIAPTPRTSQVIAASCFRTVVHDRAASRTSGSQKAHA